MSEKVQALPPLTGRVTKAQEIPVGLHLTEMGVELSHCGLSAAATQAFSRIRMRGVSATTLGCLG